MGDPVRRLAEALVRYRAWAMANPHLHRLLFDAPAHGVIPESATRRAAADLWALFAAAGPSRAEGLARFAAVHGGVQLELSGLAFPPPGHHT